MKLLTPSEHHPHGPGVQALAHTADVRPLPLEGVQRIDLCFPVFTDGRAFSQAVWLRRRGYQGVLRATGDVRIDQLLQMRRCGFSEAVLSADQSLADGQRLLKAFSGFYQGDALHPRPPFASAQ
jgi:uncharacterized protein (DUF934 family)